MTQELTIIQEKDLKSAGTVLATTKDWVSKYTKKHNSLVELSKKEGVKLSPETDQAINDFLSGVKKAAKAAEDARKPFTSKLNEVIGLFTAQESILKANLVTDLQAARDASVAEYRKEQLAEQAKEQDRLDKVRARIELLADAEGQIRTQYANLLSEDKAKLMEVYEGCTIEMYEPILEMLDGVVGTFTQDMWEGISATIDHKQFAQAKHFTAEEISAICIEAKEGKFEKVAPHYQSEIKAYAKHLSSLMPERKIELETGIQESAAAEKLKEDQATAEAEQAKLAEAKTEKSVQTQLSAAIIDSQINTANRSLSIPKGHTVESYEIIVNDNLGWSEIFKFYVAHSELNIEGKTKLDSMKLFAERVAKSQGLRIESPYVKYEAKYKAVNRSKKAA